MHVYICICVDYCFYFSFTLEIPPERQCGACSNLARPRKLKVDPQQGLVQQ